MKLYISLMIGLFSACAGGRNVAQTPTIYTVSGKVQQLFPYCGGARPTQEMLDKLAIPIAYPNKVFYIKKGNTNDIKHKVIKSFTTNEKGLFSVELPAGTYCIILEEQLKPINPNDYNTEKQKIDEQCLIEWWKKPYYILEVKDQHITSLDFTFLHRCFLTSDIPCITYTGPMPH